MEGKPSTPATDIFSFGLVCGEMLCGDESVMAGRLRATDAVKARAERYWPILEHACQEEPSKRWESVRAMMDAFRSPGPSSFSAAPRLPTSMRRETVIRRARQQHQLAWVMAVFGILLATVVAFLVLRQESMLRQESIRAEGGAPVVVIKHLTLVWETPEKLQVHVSGEVQRAQPQRMLMEVVLCSKSGDRIYSAQSTLVDRSLGAVQVFDVVKTPQTFDKTLIFRVPRTIDEGYAAATFFDHANMLVAHQNSALWKKPTGD
jgi:hypothetical protein